MPVSVSEMLETLDAAIHDTPWWLPWAPALELVGRREVLGQYGTPVHTNHRDTVNDPMDMTPLATPVTHAGVVYSFNRRQCKAMRKKILSAAHTAAFVPDNPRLPQDAGAERQ